MNYLDDDLPSYEHEDGWLFILPLWLQRTYGDGPYTQTQITNGTQSLNDALAVRYQQLRNPTVNYTPNSRFIDEYINQYRMQEHPLPGTGMDLRYVFSSVQEFQNFLLGKPDYQALIENQIYEYFVTESGEVLFFQKTAS